MSAWRGTSVFVVEDHAIFREGLRMFLASTDDVRVVGEAALAGDAAAGLEACAPDIVLLDLALPDEDGLSALPRLREAAPGARFVIMSGVRDRSRQKEALVGGAEGYLTKDQPPDLMLKAIRRVHAGELWYDRALLQSTLHEAVEAVRRADPDRARIGSLTPREREIAALVGEGLRNDEIAHRLAICEKTVRNHLGDIFEKLSVHGRLELLLFVNHHGLGRLRPAAPSAP